MSHRGSVYVQRGGVVTSVSHRHANRFWQKMCWGPEFLLPWIQTREDDDVWFPTAFDEAMAFVDLKRRFLLFYGGHDDDFIWELRADFVHFLRAAWPGWTVEFAVHGQDDIRQQLKLDLGEGERLRPDRSDLSLSGDWVERARGFWGREPDDATLLGSAVDVGGNLRVGWAPDLLFDCPFAELTIDVLLAQVTELQTRVELPIAPSAGFHLDVPAQKLYYWSGKPVHARARVEAMERTEGWRRQHLSGELDGHLSLLGDSCRVGRQAQRERYMEMARHFLWWNEVDAYRSAWSEREALEPEVRDWLVPPDVAYARSRTVLDRLGVVGSTVEQELLRLPARGSQETPVRYCARVDVRFGRAWNAARG